MKKPNRKLIYAIAAIILIVLLVLAFKPGTVQVDSAAVTRGPLTATVQDRGETRVLDRYVVTSPIAGNLERIPFRPGDAVDRGEVIARISPASLSAVQGQQSRAEVDRAEAYVRAGRANLGRAESNAGLATKQRERTAALRAEGVASQEALDTARSSEEAARREVQSARAALAQATAEVDAARAALLGTHSGGGAAVELRAPADARIFAIPERSGRPVAPGDPIMTLGNPREIEAVVDVLSQDAVKIAPGDRAFLVDWGGDHPLPAVVKNVESSAFTKISALGIEEQRVHVVVSILNPPPALGDAYRVQGQIVVWTSPAAVQVPIGALTRFGQQWGVFLIDKGRARERKIEIGHRNDTAAEVLSGLQPGERVIVHPGDDVAEGVRVAEEQR